MVRQISKQICQKSLKPGQNGDKQELYIVRKVNYHKIRWCARENIDSNGLNRA